MAASKERPTWFRPRAYRHFDTPSGLTETEHFVTRPTNITRHNFFPFIRYDKVVKKYKPQEKKTRFKERPISYASHRDSHVFSYYSFLLSKAYEKTLETLGISDCVLAYRSCGKTNIHFAAKAFEDIKSLGPCTAIAFDIERFFDNLDHSLLKRRWSQVIDRASLPSDHYSVFRAITKYSWVFRDELYRQLQIADAYSSGRNEPLCSIEDFRQIVRRQGNLIQVNHLTKGIPQGSPISAMLSNVYMLDFDLACNQLASRINGSYFRYSDDILFIVPNDQESIVREAVVAAIRQVELQINDSKTDTIRFEPTPNGALTSDRPLNYLGFSFDGDQPFLRSSTLARYFRNAKRAVQWELRNAVREARPFLRRRHIYDRFTVLGERNFPSYVRRSNAVMRSPRLNRQLSRLGKLLQKEIVKAKDTLAARS